MSPTSTPKRGLGFWIFAFVLAVAAVGILATMRGPVVPSAESPYERHRATMERFCANEEHTSKFKLYSELSQSERKDHADCDNFYESLRRESESHNR